MKRLIWIFIGTGTIVALGLIVAGTGKRSVSANQTTESTAAADSPIAAQAVKSHPPEKGGQLDSSVTPNMPRTTVEPVASEKPSTNPAPAPPADLLLDQAFNTIVSARASFDQKQAAWKQLRKTGKLDRVISELEQRVAANPESAESIAALGQAYYKKAGDTEDIRESAILAMKADKSLEAALNLDPSNWDARYMRAAGMAHWPSELNKTKEVIEQFQALIQDQESQASQPHFAKSYLKLGEVYEKAGYGKYAADMWQRGASLFPADTELKEKLAAPK